MLPTSKPKVLLRPLLLSSTMGKKRRFIDTTWLIDNGHLGLVRTMIPSALSLVSWVVLFPKLVFTTPLILSALLWYEWIWMIWRDILINVLDNGNRWINGLTLPLSSLAPLISSNWMLVSRNSTSTSPFVPTLSATNSLLLTSLFGVLWRVSNHSIHINQHNSNVVKCSFSRVCSCLQDQEGICWHLPWSLVRIRLFPRCCSIGC